MVPSIPLKYTHNCENSGVCTKPHNLFKGSSRCWNSRQVKRRKSKKAHYSKIFNSILEIIETALHLSCSS